MVRRADSSETVDNLHIPPTRDKIEALAEIILPAEVQMGIPESEKQFMKTAISVARAAEEIRRIRKVISRIPKAIRRAKSIPPRIQ